MLRPRPPLTPGKLNQRLTIQAPDTAEDALGQRVGTWADVATYWGEARPLQGRELLAGGAQQSQGTVLFKLRWRDDITSAMRVLWRGVPYAIVAPPVDVDGGRHTLELTCTSGVAL